MSDVPGAAPRRLEGEGWPDEVVEAVCKEYLSGLSAGQIAKKRGWTRNVANGIVSRNVHLFTLTGKAPTHRAHERGKTASLTKKLQGKGRPGDAMKAAVAKAKGFEIGQPKPEGLPTNLRELPTEQMRMVPHAKLEPWMCSWPVGEPGPDGFLCCGRNRAANHRLYCPQHAGFAKGAPGPSVSELERMLRRHL